MDQGSNLARGRVARAWAFGSGSSAATAGAFFDHDGNGFPKLYAFTTAISNRDNVNFLEHLVRHEAGVQGSIDADAMVTRFTSDLWKLAQDGGLTMSEGTTLLGELNNVNQALIAFAMQFYYEENNPNITYGTELFTDLSTAGTGNNGIQFDMPGDSINDTQWRITA